MSLRRSLLLMILLLIGAAQAQVIEFESGGLKYKTLTHNGITVMFAPLGTRIHDYAIIQVAISNGSPISWAFKPDDFHFERADGTAVQASTASDVVETLMQKGNRGDVMKLLTVYESGLYQNARIHSTNGFESRRQNMLANMGSSKLNAAAAASAMVLALIKLGPGQSTDGAVFFPNQGKPLGAGKLVGNTGGEVFTFPVDSEPLKGR